VAEDLSAVPAVVLQKGGSGRIRGGDIFALMYLKVPRVRVRKDCCGREWIESKVMGAGVYSRERERERERDGRACSDAAFPADP